jgi:hypothetical protein
MAQSKYQVTLAVEGKHSVSVASDDPAAVTEGLVWAQATYKKLLGLRQGPQLGANGQGAQGVSEPPYQRVDAETDAPICGVHEVPMVWQQGRKGYFWSCHEKNPDGSWCSYKAPR